MAAALAPPLSPPRSSGRIPGVEGLRGVAALSIVVWHVWAHPTLDNHYGVGLGFGPLTDVFSNLQAGVAMFFVLSGFLLYRPFAGALQRGRELPPVRPYLLNRALRILPAYWVILLLIAVLFQHRLLDRPLQLLTNMFFLQGYVPSYIGGWSDGLGINPAWSLCVEVVFYIVLPLLILGAVATTRRLHLARERAALLPIVLLTMVGIASTLLAAQLSLGPVWEDSFPTHAGWFAVGMALALVRNRWEDGELRLPAYWRPLAAFAGLLAAAAAIKLRNQLDVTFLEEQWLLALSCGVLLALVVLPGRRSVLGSALERRVPATVGLVSYSIFLWHDPLLGVLRAHGLTMGGVLGVGVDTCLVLALAGAASAATYLFVERPALARKRRSTIRVEAPESQPLPALTAQAL